MNYNEETGLSRAECLQILNTPDESLGELIEKAFSLHTKYKGNRVSIQLLTDVRSGNCTQNCAYCAHEKVGNAYLLFHRILDRTPDAHFKGSRARPHQPQFKYESPFLSWNLQHAYVRTPHSKYSDVATRRFCNLAWLFAGVLLQGIFRKHHRIFYTLMGLSLLYCAIGIVW